MSCIPFGNALQSVIIFWKSQPSDCNTVVYCSIQCIVALFGH